jgi:excisionase family DNA binding protein
MARPKSRADEISAAAEPYLGTKEAAALLGVSVSTIQKMVEAGTLRAWKTQGGHRRVAERDVLEMKSTGLASPSRASHRGPVAVLIVEDNPVQLKAYSKAVADWGPRVAVSYAGDGAAALLTIVQRRPELVITDLAMEPFDGFPLIRTLRGSIELQDTRVLVVTGLSDDEIAARGGLDDLTLCYRKPLSLQRLHGYIDALVHRRSPAENTK